MNFKIFVLLLLISFPAETFSWEKEEHRMLADLAFDSTLSFCGIEFTDSLIFFPGKNGSITLNRKLWKNRTFGNISAFFSGDDISQSRCQSRGLTINQQLKSLSPAYIDEVWDRIKKSPGDINSVEVSNQNAVFNYLLYHLIALRFAKLSANESDNNPQALRNALIYEAVAQSYLSDAFSSGHLLLFVSDFLAPLNSFNIQIAHDYYCSEGVYVINSNGECWQAFGDKLLQWYPYSFNRVLEACAVSLRELFLVYYTSLGNIELPEHLDGWAQSIADGTTIEKLSDSWAVSNDGDKYYSEIKMPALLCIPIPVAATWSVHTERKDEYGYYKRKHYPQLKEDKFHDPDLKDIDEDFLYSKKSIPGWMIPEFLPNDTLTNLIRYQPDIASVRYIQNRSLPPSLTGHLLNAGGAIVFNKDNYLNGAFLGTGWGFADIFLVMIKPSVNISAMRFFGRNEGWLLMGDLGFAINVPVFSVLNPRFDIGYIWGFQSPYEGGAGKFSLGLESETLPLGFTYAGLTFRIKSQFLFFRKTLYSQVLEVVLH